MKDMYYSALVFIIALLVFSFCIFILVPVKDGFFAITYVFTLLFSSIVFGTSITAIYKKQKDATPDYSLVKKAWLYLALSVGLSIVFNLLKIRFSFVNALLVVFLLCQVALLVLYTLSALYHIKKQPPTTSKAATSKSFRNNTNNSLDDSITPKN